MFLPSSGFIAFSELSIFGVLFKGAFPFIVGTNVLMVFGFRLVDIKNIRDDRENRSTISKAMPVFLDNSVYFVLSICSLIVVIDHPLTSGTTLFCSMPARLNRVVCSALTCRSSPLSVSTTASIVTP